MIQLIGKNKDIQVENELQITNPINNFSTRLAVIFINRTKKNPKVVKRNKDSKEDNRSANIKFISF